MVTISTLAFAVRTASSSTRHPVTLSHAQQLVAAALGYRSLAAWQASKEPENLDEVGHYIPDGKLLAERIESLGLPNDFAELASLVSAAFESHLPSATLHMNDLSWDDYVRRHVQRVVMNDDDVSGAMAITNSDDIDEIYLPFDADLASFPSDGSEFDEEFDGHIAMSPDVERPYSGHMIDVSVHLTVERKGKVILAEPVCEVVSAKLRFDWGDDEDEQDSAPTSLAEALADELGLDLMEAEELVDAEPIPVTSEDGLLYRYVFDFAPFATPAVAQKLMAKYGRLQIDMPPWFFDRIASNA